jgi:hypothetical protein
MMNKLFVTLALVGYAVAGPLSKFGQGFADMNKGFCLAFQDDQTDDTNNCYISCLDTEPKIIAFFDAVDLTNNEDMTNTLQNMGIQFMTQFKNCRTTEFLFSLDNRLSDSAFLSGTIANLASQGGTFGGYLYMVGGIECDPATITDSTKKVFCKLLKKHSITKIYDDLKPQLQTILDGTTTDYKKIGQVATNFLLSVVNYKAPNVNTGLKSK